MYTVLDTFSHNNGVSIVQLLYNWNILIHTIGVLFSLFCLNYSNCHSHWAPSLNFNSHYLHHFYPQLSLGRLEKTSHISQWMNLEKKIKKIFASFILFFIPQNYFPLMFCKVLFFSISNLALASACKNHAT